MNVADLERLERTLRYRKRLPRTLDEIKQAFGLNDDHIMIAHLSSTRPVVITVPELKVMKHVTFDKHLLPCWGWTGKAFGDTFMLNGQTLHGPTFIYDLFENDRDNQKLYPQCDNQALFTCANPRHWGLTPSNFAARHTEGYIYPESRFYGD